MKMSVPQFVVPYRRRRRAAAFIRKVRAVWRDTRALWQQFRKPILAFLLVTLVGGYIYGEIYYSLRGVWIPLIDLPYIMLQLMILETPEDVPPEWQLVLFWYALPPILVFIVGNGVADFVRLFFNRDERRDAWREAVASTYRNHVIVFGAGHVGTRVIRTLADMGFDVVVIDNDPDDGVEDLMRALDIPLLVLDGRASSTLEKAGLREAEAFVACTGNDQVNLEAIMRARDMNPDVRIVARVWDDQFAQQITRFMNVQAVLSSSELSAPVFAGLAVGVDMAQTLRVNGVSYSTVRLTVAQGSFLAGQDVGTLQKENNMDIVLHSSGANVRVQPPRDAIVRAGDTLVIFAHHERVLDVVARNREK
jgi:Trk K+ transport system NAD-binding subunit